jgi:hypothetical protein
MEALIMVVFLGVAGGLLVTWFRRAAKASSRKAPPEVTEQLAEAGATLNSKTECYGIDGHDLEGTGSLVLLGDEVAFMRWEPVGEWRLPLKKVEAFDSRMFWPAGEKMRAGGTLIGTGKRRNALRIFWEGGYALFWTPERLQWLSALEDATGKKRTAEGTIEAPLRPNSAPVDR